MKFEGYNKIIIGLTKNLEIEEGKIQFKRKRLYGRSWHRSHAGDDVHLTKDCLLNSGAIDSETSLQTWHNEYYEVYALRLTLYNDACLHPKDGGSK